MCSPSLLLTKNVFVDNTAHAVINITKRMRPENSGLACICAIVSCYNLFVLRDHFCESHDLGLRVMASEVGKVFYSVV